MVRVSSWGRLDSGEHELVALADRAAVTRQIARGADAAAGLAQGNARSYGDVCLNPGGRLWRTTGLDRFIAFDPDSGRLRCEAGMLLRDLQRMSLAHGWLLAVTPGTQLVTVGGAIANDVHGKNHHVLGSFGDHVLGLRLARTDGSVIDCGPDRDAGWFAATVGGMGLTGVIVEAELQLRRVAGPWLVTDTIPYRGLDEFFHLADGSEAGWEQTVSWIDCLSGAGRGLFFRANPAHRPDPMPARPSGHQPGRRSDRHAGRQAWRVPLAPPLSLVNGLSLRAFNAAYFRLGSRRAGPALAHFERYSYPLDTLHDWNRMYGPRGFYQYQSVVPRAGGADAVQAMLAAIRASGQGSFLAVLKTFGQRAGRGMMSFPRPGVTLALDFPNRGETTLRLFDRLDAIVREAGGRLYAAKDARMPRELFEAGYPRLAEFLHYRDPGVSSSMSRRLMGS